MNRIICLILVLCMTLSISITASAKQNTGVPVGGLTQEDLLLSNEDIIQGILDDPTISDAEKQQLIDKLNILATVSRESDIALCYDPDMEYILNIPGIMQETGWYCGPAVVQQVLSYYGASYDSQSYIYNTVFNGAAAMSKLIDYINSKQNVNTFYRHIFSGQQELDTIIRAAYQGGSPIIYTVCVSNEAFLSGKWPYRTDGHFTNLCGFTSDHNYLLADPFYYDKYVSGASRNPAGEGFHYKSFSDLIDANSGYGLGYNYLAW